MQINIMSSNTFNEYLKKAKIYYNHFPTKAGTLTIYSTDDGIYQASFDFFQVGENCHMNQNISISKLLLVGTDFQIKVWKTILKIPAGKTMTYEQIAYEIENPKGYRAVANALAHNKIAYFIPCHRVLRKNGSLGGYKWGKDKKKSLLQIEQKNECHS